MDTTFIALSNMAGIACASDTDHTIYQLSKKQPLALAVNPFSPIPWERIVNAYKDKGEPEPLNDIEAYAMEFINHMASFPAMESWKKLSPDEANLIFMGFGKEDLFPSLFDVFVGYDEETGHIEIKEKHCSKISHDHVAYINILGNLDSVSSILWGTTRETNDFLMKKHLECFEIYKNRLIEKFRGTDAEDYVKGKLEEFEPEEVFASVIEEAVDQTFSEVAIGMDSFSMEDMVAAAETIVDAEVRLDHLRSGCKDALHSTREIAVVTRVEGLTWVKHGLYAL